MKKIILLLLLLSNPIYSQVRGTVTDTNGNPISFVNIYLKDTYTSTTSNDLGRFEINLKIPGIYVVLFQYLGYKTEKVVVTIEKIPVNIDVQLKEEDFQLNEIVVSKKDNPAIAIMKNAIANRKENSAKTAKYKCDFYSRGVIKVKDLPKKFMGQEITEFDDVVDSTRSGILYLSETVSKIIFQKPDKLNETIIASKVSGNSRGVSFNTASQANFDFYENYLDFDTKVISPIADNAFNYYKFQFEGSFFDENNQQINKIKVTPKRENEPAMEGYIYIVEDSWAIYATDLTIKGSQIQNPVINSLQIKQNFSYNSINKIWVKNTQTIDFNAGIFAFKFNGRFTHGYSNFEFPDKFDKKTFSREILKFEENATKKDDAFWATIRPVPLTDEESNDYVKKEKLRIKKTSQVYLDSIDKKHSKFKLSSPIMGYSYSNTFKKWSVQYDGPLMATSYNTVQGFNSNVGIYFNKRDEEKNTFSSTGVRITYGFAEDKVRVVASHTQKFNNTNKATLSVFGGSSVSQFNQNKPIANIVNAVSSLFFKNNFMKLYEKNFVAANFSREIMNGLNLTFGAEYAERKPLYNTTDYAFIKSDDLYSSNNPLLPNDFLNLPFQKNNLVKTNINATIKFGQRYYSRPDGKYSFNNEKYPTINLGYEKTMAATNKDYEYDLVTAKVSDEFSIGNKGKLQVNLMAGKFFNADNIAFTDFKHFNGNQTHISHGMSYLTEFNLLPYYSSSTNDSYFETHLEHNDKGYLMNKLPLLKKLQSQLVLGFHNLAIPDRTPYREFTVGLDNLGFGKIKFLRIDYIRSYQNGFQGDGVVFGIKLLEMFRN